ncbi:hypothetical protein F4861DRAFT_532841 [Xylaria intraflava]|nr:hypothetical protein F4861DRAFT_532841 [Xylaria intraflava]
MATINKPSEVHRSSTYGQACSQCYKAKCRCVPNAMGDTCERCHRLKKRCQPSNSVRNRAARKAEESDSRIAQLEGKIEMLMTAMQSVVNPTSTPANIDEPIDAESIIPLFTPSPMGIQADSGRTSSASVIDQPTPTSDSAPTSLQIIPASPSLPDIPHQQAEQAVSFFRYRMLPCFPFIDLAPETTTEQLRQTRPFLFHAIVTVTTFSTQKRLALAEDLKHRLFTSVLANVQSSIDLLLGLLTYLAWSTDVFLGRADLVSRLMMLAISLVYDLRLFKPCSPDVKLFMTMTQGKPYESDQNAGNETVNDFMEKQRALLACFILSSNISSHLGRQDALRWTPQMEEACHVIENNKSLPADQLFAFQVRLHAVKQRAVYIRDERDGARAAFAPAIHSIPSLLYLRTVREQLHELRSSFPTDIRNRGILNAHAQYVEMYITQLTYLMNLDSQPLDMSGSSGLLPRVEQLECLWRSVECVKLWLDSFYEIPPSEMIGLPFHFWLQIIQCFTFLKSLPLLRDPAWDCHAIRNTIDMNSALDGMIRKLDIAGKEPGVFDDSLPQLLCRLLYRCRAWIDSRRAFVPQPDAGARTIPSTGLGLAGHCHFTSDSDQMLWTESMDLENEQWLESLLDGYSAASSS